MAAGLLAVAAPGRPPAAQPVAGRPLLKHVIDAARALQPAATYVVYGHGGDRVRETLKDEQVSWVLQAERLGTGHAVMQAAPGIPDDHTVLVLYGDVPLIRTATLNELLTLSGPKQVGLLTMIVADPTADALIRVNPDTGEESIFLAGVPSPRTLWEYTGPALQRPVLSARRSANGITISWNDPVAA